MTDVGKIKLGVEIDADNLSAKLGAAVRQAITPALQAIQAELNKVQREYDKTATSAEKSSAKQVTANKLVEKSLRDVERQAIKTAAAIKAIPNAPGGAGRQGTGGPFGGGNSRATETVRRQKVDNDGLAAAARRVATAQNEANSAVEIFGRKSSQTAAAHKKLATANSAHTSALLRAAAESKAATDSQVNDYQRLAREAEESAARQAAADRAASGGRRGPPRGGGGRGGVLGFLTGPVGLNSIALGAQALPAALTGVTALVGAVQQLGQAGLALPAIYGAVGASVGVAVLGFHGMKDAVKALNDAVKSGDMTKANEALKEMAPEAQNVAKVLSKLSQGPLKDLRKGVQSHMFAGFDKDLENTANRVIPRLTGNINGIGDAWNGTLKGFTKSLGSERNLSLIDRFLGNTAKGQTNANKAIEPLTHALATLMSTGGEFLPRLGDALGKVADRFDNFISKNGASGQLWKWIDEGINGMRALGDAVLNIGKTLTGLTHAAGGDGGFLGWLERATGKMSAFVNSADGQGKLGEFFKMGKEDLHRWGELLSTLAPILLQIVKGFAQWGEVMLPIITALAQMVGSLNQIPGLVSAAVTAFLAFRTVGPLLGMMGAGAGAGGGLMGKMFGGGAAAAGAAGGGRGGILGNPALMRGLIGLAGAGIGWQTESNARTGGGQAIGALEMIGGGALAGSAFGPAGAAIGGIAGGGAAVLAHFQNDINRDAQGEAEARARSAAQTERQNVAMAAMKDAQLSINSSLLDSGGKIDAGTIAGVGAKINALPDSLGQYDPKIIAEVRDDLGKLGIDSKQLATIVANGGPVMDALVLRLQQMGPSGAIAAQSLQQITMNTQQAAGVAAQANPALRSIADAFTGGNLAQASTNIQQLFNALANGQAVTANMPGVTGPGGLLDILHQLNVGTTTGAGGVITLTNGIDPAILTTLQQITGKIIEVNAQGELRIQTGTAQTQLLQLDQQLQTFMNQWRNMVITPQIQPHVDLPMPQGPNIQTAPGSGGYPGIQIPRPGGFAGGIMRGYPTGGVLPGYSPGVDNMMVPLSGGEGIIIPEAMRALGGGWLYGLNSSFRGGISRAGYASGGVHGYAPGGVNDNTLGNDTTTIGLLVQIRDLLAGRGSGASGPLSNMANNTQLMASGMSPGSMMGGGGGGMMGGTSPARMGPFGTPIPARNHGWEMMAAAIQALGGQPELFIGANPAMYGGGMGMPGMGGMGGGMMPGMGGGADMGRYAAALSAFARSGKIGDVSGLGLDANDSVISAIASARNKKKGGLTDEQISALVDQVVGGGGFTGTLDPTNTALVRALTTFREKMMKGGMMPGMMPGAGMAPSAFGGPGGLVPFDGSGAGSGQALINFAQRSAGGKYAAASDLAGGLADCSGAVSDLVEFLTQGKTSPARLFSTANEAQVLQSLGAVPGLVPGSLQIGMNSGHTAATLPNGVNFESGGSGGGVVYGGPVGAGDKQFTQTFSLPTDGTGRFVGAGMPGGMSAAGMPGMGGGMGAGGVQQVFVVNMPGGGAGFPGGDAATLQAAGMASQVLGPGAGAAVGAGGQALSDAVRGIGLPGLSVTPTAKNTALAKLLHERNPMAIASALGIDVEDHTRAGGGVGGAAGVQAPEQGYDATGRLFSNTGALLDRTMSDMSAQIDAMRSQTVGVMEGVKTKLTDKALEPIVTSGVNAGFSGLNPSTFAGMGTAIGQAAAPPIAQAVSAAMPMPTAGTIPGTTDTGGFDLGAMTGMIGLAGGGPVSGGTPGRDSVPALLMPNEFVFNTTDVARMGGTAGVERFRSALGRGGLRRFAAGGTVGGKRIGNDELGADFFGVSEIPLIGTIVNLIIRVLLKVIGIEVEVRDTMMNLSEDFRGFRGDAFKAFDAQGRLLNDTSSLIDRSSTSSQTAADERIRILKIVIEALIKYIIEKVVVPITKAIANAALQGVSSAAGMAINSQAPGAGSIASAAITAIGQAGIEIGAEVGTDFALALSSTLIDVIAEGFQSILPDLMTQVFSGGFISMLFAPLGGMLTTLLGGFMGVFTAIFGGLFGGVSTLIPGIPFDNGGLAKGMGLLPKATYGDELMLSPTETDIFTRFVSALERGGFGSSGSTTIHSPITVMGGSPETPQQIQDRLLKFMP